ncbi:hypothetical protein A9Q93_02040 [Nonlabens dokdonensis]|uniref:Uncharacterized protein n=3 Tax=Nonlabens dokdonensis TaxID=328515 RepID=A0A1Z8BBS9_9FLAO|nr:hypothetical protein A9Q93_02040 [Nonlabens dokdonensis]
MFFTSILNKAHFTDQLNIILVIIAALLAYVFPLELFIFSYTLLGPLHYVTEINWLHNKSYFFTSNKMVWLSIGLFASLILFVPKLFLYCENSDTTLTKTMVFINDWSNSVIFITLMLAVACQFISSKIAWIIISLFSFIGAVFLKNVEQYKLLIGVFVPTIIHVYLFTIIFMLYGAKKSKSNYGYISVALVLLIPIIIINLELARGSYLFSDFSKELYLNNDFHVLPVILSKFLGMTDGTEFYFYESIWLKFMMFISFIYCYHYLNWFSKTTVIKWHKMLDKKKMIAIVVIWITVMFLYWYDFGLGLLISLFLGFIHVILEFPLNMYSLKKLFY